MPRIHGRDSIYTIAEYWRERCLAQDGSLLWPSVKQLTWTQENLADFLEAFWKSGHRNSSFLQTSGKSSLGISPMPCIESLPTR